jgi:hypothetical protein
VGVTTSLWKGDPNTKHVEVWKEQNMVMGPDGPEMTVPERARSNLLDWNIKAKVTLRLAVYHQSVHLGAKL